ncbi:MAG TPA: alpha/beta hydrolase [Candidatus Dormibacteraeota bacterium]|jgi:pimeloyl-ACP methyl ester carboxylesterase
MPHADMNGQRIWFSDSGGVGSPLVLTHGFLLDSDMFEPQVAALGEEYRVITWDQRGHGRTESTPDPFTFWDSADDQRALLDHLGIEQAVVGGMSQGGFIALRFALRYPERTAGLVLIDTQAGLEDPDMVPQYDLMLEVWTKEGPSEQLTEMVAAIIIGNQPEAAARYVEKWKSVGSDRLRQVYRTLMDRDDVTDRLGEIRVPALVIHGENDTAIPMERAEALWRALPGCRGVHTIAGAGHASNLIQPEAVNRGISEFLASMPVGRT